MRVGLVGYACASGLGVTTAEFFRHLPFAKWLVVRHARRPISELLPDDRCTVANRNLTDVDLASWFDGLDAVFSIETSYSPVLWEEARRRGVRIVLMPNVEYFNVTSRAWPYVDRFIAPTAHCAEYLAANGFGSRVLHVPHPVDLDRFAFRQRKKARVFVHYRGWGGYRSRKGTRAVMRAAERCPSVRFLVRWQKPYRGHAPDNVEMRGAVRHPGDLYRDGDVAVQPSRWEGVGTQIMQAMACGQPVFVPDGPPMREHAADAFFTVPARRRYVALAGRPWPACEIDVAELSRRIRAIAGADLTSYSLAARRKMEAHGWAVVGPALARALELEFTPDRVRVTAFRTR